MAMTDPIADLLTRIRNAQQAGHPLVTMPASRIKQRILEILKEEGYVLEIRRISQHPQDVLEVDLKYGLDHRGAIAGLKRESRPGRRIYVGAQQIPRVRHGLGIAIVSTSRGVLPDHLARKEQVGGELLCTIW